MKRKVRRVIVLGAVLALAGVLAFGAGAFAKGPDGGGNAQTQERSGTQTEQATQARTQESAQTQNQESTQTQTQERVQTQVNSGTGASCHGDCDGSQERSGQTGGNGEGSGPGQYCNCPDVTQDGLCVCAMGPASGDQAQVQKQAQQQTQVSAKMRTQVYSQAKLSCTGDCDGSQERNGQASRKGKVYGPGDGSGPIGGEQFGPGPKGQCLDADENGVCDCQE
jgi:hypothetical protein